jgi:uncharacterized membrane protein YhaH (DUF805 family)
LIPHLVVLALIVVFGYLFENRFLDKASRLPPVLWYPCGVAFPVAAVMLVVFSFSHLVRRLHDLEEPSWMALVALVPIINIPLLWRVYFREGGSGNGSGNADLSAGLANKPMQTDGPSGRR